MLQIVLLVPKHSPDLDATVICKIYNFEGLPFWDEGSHNL